MAPDKCMKDDFSEDTAEDDSQQTHGKQQTKQKAQKAHHRSITDWWFWYRVTNHLGPSMKGK